MQTQNVVLENVFGLISLVFWSLQLVPQIYQNYKRSSTAGMSILMMAIWYLGVLPQDPYYIFINVSIPLMFQPHTFTLLVWTLIVQDVFYEMKLTGNSYWARLFGQKKLECTDIPRDTFTNELSLNVNDSSETISAAAEDNLVKKPDAQTIPLKTRIFRSAIVGGSLLILWLFVELGFLFLLYRTHSVALKTGLGIAPSVFALLGYLPQYAEIWRTKDGRGLSILFLLMDFAGGIFGILSLLFKAGDFETIAAVTYSSILLGDGLLIVFWVVLGSAKKGDVEHMIPNEEPVRL